MDAWRPRSASGVLGTTPFGLPYWDITLYTLNGDDGRWIEAAYPGTEVSPGLSDDYQVILARAQASGRIYREYHYDIRSSVPTYIPLTPAEVDFNSRVVVEISWFNNSTRTQPWLLRDSGPDEYSTGQDFESWEDYNGQSLLLATLTKFMPMSELVDTLNIFRRTFVIENAWIQGASPSLNVIIYSELPLADWVTMNGNGQLVAKFAAAFRGIEII